MIRTLQNLCEKSRCPSESKVFIYSFETIRHASIKTHQGLSTYPSTTVSTFDEHLMLLGMNLTSTTTFKENRMTALQFCELQKKKQCRHACEKLSSVLEMSKFQETRSVIFCDYHSYAQLMWKIFVWAP